MGSCQKPTETQWGNLNLFPEIFDESATSLDMSKKHRSQCIRVYPLHTVDMVSWWLHTGKRHDEAIHNCVGVSVFCVLNGVEGDSKFTGTNSNIILPNPVTCTLNLHSTYIESAHFTMLAKGNSRYGSVKYVMTAVFRVVEWTGNQCWNWKQKSVIDTHHAVGILCNDVVNLAPRWTSFIIFTNINLYS